MLLVNLQNNRCKPVAMQLLKKNSYKPLKKVLEPKPKLYSMLVSWLPPVTTVYQTRPGACPYPTHVHSKWMTMLTLSLTTTTW